METTIALIAFGLMFLLTIPKLASESSSGSNESKGDEDERED